jgi:predicted metalloprotease with PDZ domain
MLKIKTGTSMKRFSYLIVLFSFINCCIAVIAKPDSPRVIYEVNVLNYQDDLFHITVYTEGLNEENNIYNLPATVPGTYSLLNFGRFVTTFAAFDKDGNPLEVEQISTNRWQISDVENLAKIKYDIEDTFDADIAEQHVIPMAGTGINEDYIVLNTFGVIGYFENLQSLPVKMKLEYDPDWTIGTSLLLDDDGYYTAESYDFFADSPILLGELTVATTKVNDIEVGVYVYSPNDSNNAEGTLEIADTLLQAIGEFIGYSPVTHYNYLICFLDEQTFQDLGFLGAGALEHSYSSLFVYPGFGNFGMGIQDDMAHEFLHILTPLNLHSNIIEPFNFETPTAPEHLWLYEGVTEWGSDISQMRGGLITTDQYLKKLSNKITHSYQFRQDISLTELSLDVYSDVITMEFLNFYEKGAVTAAMLDIRLLELSNGTRGLREVFLDLLEQYGKNKPFPEDEFFEIFVANTYPEIEVFIEDYIKGTKTLPYQEYMAKLGFNYIKERPSEDSRPSLGIQMGMNDQQQLTIVGLDENAGNSELKVGDVPLKILDIDVNMENARQIFGKLHSMNVGETVNVLVRRGDEEVEVNVTLHQRMDKNIFEEMENPSEEQLQLREAWSKNL